ncbi:MAG: polysaccharide biosynthesis protein [Oscillospiraceae bacterium]|jgi:stage V sporulation protein B|nr:polysaccharide biosynthesis protein [Oscillospiraceae bacterium]
MREKKSSSRNQSLMQGALILTIGAIMVKVIGALFKIPLAGAIKETGMGYFSTAYSIYLPIYVLATAGFPSAIARQISENAALGRFKDVRKIKQVVSRVLLTAGIFGTVAMVLAGFIYVNMANKTNAIYSVITLAPSILFCCIMSIYRGYYEGLRNMTPTTISQIIEALGKLFLGLGMAIGLVYYAEYSFNTTGKFFGKSFDTAKDAVYASYPYAAAAAILGITLGSMLGMIYLMFRYKTVGDGITERELRNSPQEKEQSQILKTLYRIGVPIALGVLVMNVTQLIDTFTIQSRLGHIDEEKLRGFYNGLISLENAKGGDVPMYLFGVYNLALNLFNLIPTITQALGVSALPALAAAWAAKQRDVVQGSINSVMKITILISVPCGFGFVAVAGPILELLYPKNPSGAAIAAPLLTVLGVAVLFNAFLSPINSMLQAIGKQDTPVKLMLIGAAIKLALNYTLVGIPEININGAPYGTLACYSFIVICSMVILVRTTGSKVNFVSVLLKPLIAGALCGIAAFASYGLISHFMHSRLNVVISIAIAGIVYVISLFLIKGITKEDILMLPKGEKFAKTLEKLRWIG